MASQSDKPAASLLTPVLFLTFNRPEHTAIVFEAIRRARPAKLYFHNDGARKNKAGESELCEKVRALVQQVDWQCEVITWFRSENAGCKMGVSSAISWFFEHEEEGIILEDDCLPDPSFFGFCAELLAKYRHDPAIMMISGNNFLPAKLVPTGQDYYFCRYAFIWGWASWRRAWEAYSLQMPQHFEEDLDEQVSSIVTNPLAKSYFKEKFRQSFEGQIDSWDFQWFYTVLSSGGAAICPRVHLVENIGFGKDSTHTSSSQATIVSRPINLPLRHPDVKTVISLRKSQSIFYVAYKSRWRLFLWQIRRHFTAK